MKKKIIPSDEVFIDILFLLLMYLSLLTMWTLFHQLFSSLQLIAILIAIYFSSLRVRSAALSTFSIRQTPGTNPGILSHLRQCYATIIGSWKQVFKGDLLFIINTLKNVALMMIE